MLRRLMVLILISLVIFMVGCQADKNKVSSSAEVAIKKVSKIYGEENPQIIDAKTSIAESTKRSMYLVVLKGNFKNGDKTSKTLKFSVTEDGKKVWSLTSDSWQEDSVDISK